MKKCPNCGYVMENDKAKYCRKCGTRQPDQIIVTDDSQSSPVSEDSPSAPVIEDNRYDEGILLGGFRKESPNDDSVQIPNDDGVQIIPGESHREEDAISLISSGEILEEDQDEDYEESVEDEETEETVFNANPPVQEPENEQTQELPKEQKSDVSGISFTSVVIFLAVLLIAGVLITAFSGNSNSDENSATEVETKIKNEQERVTSHSCYIGDLGHCIYSGVVDSYNKPHGQGYAAFDDGRSYSGSFFHGELVNGVEGVFTYPNGDTFRGMFSNNRFYKGTYTKALDGSFYIGSFRDGKEDSGRWHDKSGNIIRRVGDAN